MERDRKGGAREQSKIIGDEMKIGDTLVVKIKGPYLLLYTTD